MVKDQLSHFLYSPTQIQAEVIRLRSELRQLEHVAIKQKVLTIEKKGVATPSTSTKELTDQIKVLEQRLANAPIFYITLAAMPTDGLKQNIVTWFINSVSPEAMVEFDYNSALLGGMVVRTGSRIHDWSLRRKILSQANNFAEVLHRV